METAMVLALIEKILVFGVPSVVKTIQAWDIEEVTVEDIQNLKILQRPEQYFDE